ncbi:MAG: Asp-tRNA(Asn)/Glu-tRNA(Gln) amidotransferase subunit GatA [Deltaproteobacteria bacterium]|nr:Asp-tRNA(Asn)/Glu-tRNA(Gln) amidotransferase subunit GatA [Deltaproteobacteria bacterium]MBI3293640.1 Asp-tRNA(Asn)/Glu-tRNA(Gln) amidotransferase subunit GatA [Deltaproteobacteria bacterium]
MNTIQELLEGYKKKATQPSTVAGDFLDRIESTNPKFNAYLEVLKEKVIARAKELDGCAGQMENLPLYGIPIAIKDNILVKGWSATAGSKILEGYRSPYTATTVERLEAAGAIVIGKTNCDEFAMGSSNESSAYGVVKNPWDETRVPGGSSGGSAAAVAANLCLGALGTDTGGSIRQPASLCGIVGMKPSYGRVSRFGVVAYASSLDQVGPFGNCVWDNARLLEVMAGFDPRDATTSQSTVGSYTGRLNSKTLNATTIGVARDWLEGVDPEVLKSFEAALATMKAAGAKIVDVAIPHARYGLSTYYILAPSEASSNLARYDGVHYGHRAKGVDSVESLYSRSRGEGFGKEVKLRIMLGTYALSAGYFDAFYTRANQVRALLKKDFEDGFQKCDTIAVPTSPCTAFRIGEKVDDPITMYLSDVFTLPVNLAGLPGISIPCGLDDKKLPIGLQLIGRSYDEASLFSIAHQFEKLRGHFPRAGAK